MEEMNSLAERSAGFVWRWRGSDAKPDALHAFADCFVPFEPERLFYNMSVWKSIECLREYVFKTAHVEMLRAKRSWIDAFDRAPWRCGGFLSAIVRPWLNPSADCVRFRRRGQQRLRSPSINRSRSLLTD